MSFRELGDRAGGAFLTPFLWWHHMLVAHFHFIDEVIAASAVFERKPKLALVKN